MGLDVSYEYLTDVKFRQRVEAVIEKFQDMREDLDRERKLMGKQWSKREAQIPAVVDLAIRTAYARRGVAHITVPNDIQVADAGADPWQHVAPASAPKTAAVYLPP